MYFLIFLRFHIKCLFLPIIFILIILISYVNKLISADLTRQTAITKLVLLQGKEGEGFSFNPSHLEFETGKLYKLIIKNNSNYKHYFSSTKFVKSIFTRKIQIKYKNEKIAEIKGHIDTVEVWPDNEVEWWFVPIKTGVFNDLHCDILDKKLNLTHSKMGMRGSIIIK